LEEKALFQIPGEEPRRIYLSLKFLEEFSPGTEREPQIVSNLLIFPREISPGIHPEKELFPEKRLLPLEDGRRKRYLREKMFFQSLRREGVLLLPGFHLMERGGPGGRAEGAEEIAFQPLPKQIFQSGERSRKKLQLRKQKGERDLPKREFFGELEFRSIPFHGAATSG
jgi:hypothetical protein